MNFFNAIVEKKYFVITFVAIALLFLSQGLLNFKLDSSSDALVLQGDESFKIYREVGNTFGNSDFLIITFTPNDKLFSKNTLETISNLESKLQSIQGVESVLSILDAPIFFQPKVGLAEIADNIKTIIDDDVDLKLAAEEIINNPIYSELIISVDAKTTALQVVLEENEEYRELINLRYKIAEGDDDLGQLPLNEINQRISEINDLEAEKRTRQIAQIRNIMNDFRGEGILFLGGPSMIATDMMAFIKSDLYVFGISVAIVFLLLLYTFFGDFRYAILPIINAAVATISTASLLGFMDWKISVVSSNFIALLLILTISLTVHILVRYNELLAHTSNKTNAIAKACQQMFLPCFFAAFTTAIAFISLILGDIKPVIEFGKMMAVGMLFSFIFTFTLLPALMQLLLPTNNFEPKWINYLQKFFSELALKTGKLMSLLSAFMFILLLIGISQLKVENRFIDYFNEDTEIFQGLYLLDQELGGTATLDIIIRAPDEKEIIIDDLDDDLFEDDLFQDDESTASGYWWNVYSLDFLEDIHDYLDDLPEVGKVLSVASGIKLARLINDNAPLNDLELALLRSVLPDDLKESLLYSYISKDDNQVRLATRVYESSESLNRNELIKNLERDLVNKFGLERNQFEITGLAVLYNNMLQSLFSSQIKSLGLVFVIIGILFFIIFRSFKIFFIGLIPNLITASMVLGLLGIFRIPLDIMTITVAAISVGMAVDNTIHYIYRYKEQLQNSASPVNAIRISHNSIGKAILYTALTISIGFLIFTFSNFTPTVLFGLFTAIALITSLLATLVLLPYLLKSSNVFR